MLKKDGAGFGQPARSDSERVGEVTVQYCNSPHEATKYSLTPKNRGVTLDSNTDADGGSSTIGSQLVAAAIGAGSMLALVLVFQVKISWL